MNTHNVYESFSQAAEKFSQRIAIECSDDHVTYGELEARSNNLANYLIASGVRKGTIIAILARDSIQVIMSIIGILKAGCVFVPLDPSLPEKRLKMMVSEALPEWFIFESRFFKTLGDVVTAGVPRARVICAGSRDVPEDYDSDLVCVEDYREHFDTERPNVNSEPNDMCYIYFTSGSTGKPKGIAGRLKAIDHFIDWEIKTFGIGEGSRMSQLTTPSFDAFLRDVFVPLCAGGTVCVPKSKETVLHVEKLVGWLDDQQINLIHCVPSLFRAIVNEDLRPQRFSSLEYILLAGEPLLPSDVKKWMDIHGERVQLVNLYGPSETTMVKTCYFVKSSDKTRRSIPIGKPMPGARIIVINERGEVCPPGVVGEIYIRTPYRALGYYNQPELTKEVFIPNPLSDDPDDIVYRTGDLGRILADGTIEFLGRKDQQVKIRGVRIELAEIENLIRDHDSVKDVAIRDWENSHHEKFLCAYIVSDAELESQEFRSFLRDYLPEDMIPSVFVRVEELPRNLNGKIDRKALPNPRDQIRKNVEYMVPRNAIEQKLVDAWQRILQIDQIGINDDFFELGGHSLRGTQLLSVISREFQIELPLRVLLERPTVAGLALAIVEKRVEQASEELVIQMVADIKRLSSEEMQVVFDDEKRSYTQGGSNE